MQHEYRERGTAETLQYVSTLVQEVGDFQCFEQGADLQAGLEIKSVNADYSTRVDRISQEKITSAIKGAFPEDGIYAEESSEGEREEKRDRRWVIDPLDGTTNYFHRGPRFAISVALQRRVNGRYRTELGVIYSPRTRTLLTAIRGEGAYLNGTRLRIVTKRTLSESLCQTNFPYDRSNPRANNISQVERVVRKVSNLRISGCASLDAASVAMGESDFYWEMFVHLWDIAAASLIVEEAGGAVRCSKHEDSAALTMITASSEELLEAVVKEILPEETNDTFRV